MLELFSCPNKIRSLPPEKMATFPDFEDNNNNEKSNDDQNRKKVHRDIERKRRQEMAALFASLRTQLPVEYLRGKRSVADQTNEAVKYIKDQEMKISKLRARRDELKKLHDDGGLVDSECGSSDNGQSCCVSISSCSQGFEVLIVSDMPPTRAMQVLLEEGFTIVRSTSTKSKQRFLHNIYVEVNELMSFDISELQWKITTAIS